MKLRCPKCHASSGNLANFIRHQDVCRVQVVKCILCGWEATRPAPAERTARPAPRGDQRKKPSPHKSHRQYQKFPCTRVGCNGTYAVTYRTKFKLCPKCASRQYSWVKRGMTTPPPYLYTNGAWIDNPERENSRKRRTP